VRFGSFLGDQRLLEFGEQGGIVRPGANGDPITVPPESEAVDYEAELAFVIGRSARRAKGDAALGAVAGYTVATMSRCATTSPGPSSGWRAGTGRLPRRSGRTS
jgi:hypothetical protein